MCGILGKLSFSKDITPKEGECLKIALALQHHRGPNATGIFENERLQLGHNRLSIIDLSHAADQPFYREDLKLRIIFNGEIYNYRTLKDQLITHGYQFFTSSDTEVLLAGYDLWGQKVCDYLVGMFAIAIWDEKDNSLFIAKDRFGEKPIFYTEENGAFIFASELNALRALYQGEFTINQNAVIDLIEYLYINLHHSIYNEVHVFPPGHSLLLKKSGEKSWREYYSFPTKSKDPIPFKELKKQTKDLLYTSVERELNADVPVATFLSSGVDSGLITAIAHDIKPDIRAVTMSTNELATDETEGASTLAKKLNIHHEIVPVNTDSLEVLGNILKDIQPLADASLIPSNLVTEQVKNRYTVMLSGDGGDEVFGSYNRPNWFRSISSPGILGGKKLIDWGFSIKNESISNRVLSKFNDNTRLKLAGWEGLFSRHNLSGGGLMDKILRSAKEQNRPLIIAQSLIQKYSANPEKLSFGLDFKSRLPGDFLFKVDSAAMHSSVEVRAPFLDHEFADFLLQIPTESLMPNGIDKELSKSLLSDFSGSNWHPPKRGFTIPYWIYLQNEWGNVLEDCLNEGLSESYFSFKKDGILEILNSHRKQSNIRFARVLFALLVLEIWLRVFHLKMSPSFLSKSLKSVS